MAIQIIEATTPDVIPAVPERVCDKWGSYRINMGAKEDSPVLNLTIEEKKFAADENGFAWSKEASFVIHVPNVFEEAENDPLLEDVVNALNAYVEAQLISAGKK